MTQAVLVDGVTNSLADTVETFYTSPADGGGTIISAFTATNNTGANRTYRGYIYNISGDPIGAVSPLKVIIRNRFDGGTALVNHIIPPGGTLRMESDLADSIVFRVTGNEI